MQCCEQRGLYPRYDGQWSQKLKAIDPFLYYSIPSMQKRALKLKDMPCASFYIERSHGGLNRSVCALEEILPAQTVDQKSHISFEGHIDTVVFDMVALLERTECKYNQTENKVVSTLHDHDLGLIMSLLPDQCASLSLFPCPFSFGLSATSIAIVICQYIQKNCSKFYMIQTTVDVLLRFYALITKEFLFGWVNPLRPANFNVLYSVHVWHIIGRSSLDIETKMPWVGSILLIPMETWSVRKHGDTILSLITMRYPSPINEYRKTFITEIVIICECIRKRYHFSLSMLLYFSHIPDTFPYSRGQNVS